MRAPECVVQQAVGREAEHQVERGGDVAGEASIVRGKRAGLVARAVHLTAAAAVGPRARRGFGAEQLREREPAIAEAAKLDHSPARDATGSGIGNANAVSHTRELQSGAGWES